MASCYRLKINQQWYQNNCGHTTIWNFMIDNIPITRHGGDKQIPKFYFDKNYIVLLPTRDEWATKNVLLSDDIVCFTDGSKLTSNGASGASVFIQTTEEEYIFPLGRLCTVFQPEVYAFMSCAKLCTVSSKDNLSIAICSDSQAALKAMASVNALQS